MNNAVLNPNTISNPNTVVYPDLAGSVALVTGGSRGIGAATAAALAANDVAVAVAGRDEAALQRVTESIWERGGRAIGIAADCTDEAQLAELHRKVGEQLGRIDICCPFAGGDGMPIPTADETAGHWRQVVESDLTSTFITISACLPDLVASPRGVVVAMSSAAARQAAQSSAAYAAAKAGVVALTRHLARELADDRVRVNCLAPSAVENDKMRAWLDDERRQQLGSQFPLGRIGQPVDIAAATLFLASSASSWITGVTLDIAGGKVMI